jgi:hypothetical protein
MSQLILMGWMLPPYLDPTEQTCPNKPWVKFIGSSAIDLSAWENQCTFKYIGSGRIALLDGSFQVDDVQVLRKMISFIIILELLYLHQ